jgi:hypothetical protein
MWFLTVLFKIIDFVEAIPYNIRFLGEITWLWVTLPFEIAKIRWDTYRTLRRIDRAERRYYEEKWS